MILFKKKVLILGSSGLLGEYLSKILKKNFVITKHKHYFKNKSDYDLSKYLNVRTLFLKTKPDVVINCAALTEVDYCQYNPKKAIKINQIIPKNIHQVCKDLKYKPHVIHFSTDQVYNNKFYKKSKEKDVNLTNQYSITKYKGEEELFGLKKLTILRINFYGIFKSKNKKSFSEFIIKNLKKKKEIKLPLNIYFNPINIKNFNNIIIKIITRKIYGLYNVGSDFVYNKYDFGLKIAKKNHLSKILIKSYISNKKHFRPLNTIMDNKKIKKKLFLKRIV